MLASASGLLRGPQSAWRKPCWTSMTRRTAFTGSMGVPPRRAGLRRSALTSTSAAGGGKDDDPSPSDMTHRVGVYVHPGHRLLDVAGPLDAFQVAGEVAGRRLYETCVLSRRGGATPADGGVSLGATRARDAAPDTLVVVGGRMDLLCDAAEVEAVRRLAAGSDRIVSICTGAFLLAEAGLLAGRRATTHWARARELQARHPDVQVEADRIFVADGRVWTSAGRHRGHRSGAGADRGGPRGRPGPGRGARARRLPPASGRAVAVLSPVADGA